MTMPFRSGNEHYLVVVADESRAEFYSSEGLHGTLSVLRTLSNKAARMKTGELISDRGGRSFDSHGQGRHTMESEKDAPKRHIAKGFAKDIAAWIGTEMHRGTFAGFALIAAPRFLGVLRQELATVTKVEPWATIDKDVVGQRETVIEELLESALPEQ
jgi:protein required for attachment to host cells